MKIKNESNWQTRDLKRVFTAILNRWNKIDPKKVPTKRLTDIVIVNSRRDLPGFFSGHAWLRSGSMRLRLPKSYLTAKEVAYLFEHELAHCAGYRHAEMGPLAHRRPMLASDRYDFVLDYPLRQKGTKEPKPKADIQIVRYQRALANLTRATTRLKRAQTIAKKHQATVRYYEKKLAADGRLAALRKDNR